MRNKLYALVLVGAVSGMTVHSISFETMSSNKLWSVTGLVSSCAGSLLAYTLYKIPNKTEASQIWDVITNDNSQKENANKLNEQGIDSEDKYYNYLWKAKYPRLCMLSIIGVGTPCAVACYKYFYQS